MQQVCLPFRLHQIPVQVLTHWISLCFRADECWQKRAHWQSGTRHFLNLQCPGRVKGSQDITLLSCFAAQITLRVLRDGVHVFWAALLQTSLWDGHSVTKTWSKLGSALVTYKQERRKYLPALSSIKKLSPEHWCHLEKQKELDTDGIPLLPLNQPVSN